ncbi:hypothetical protein scyTo_0009730 [Scyliorhinus torazame]|uniref:Uncharacterized protein n=1 Tax=Scyliorhinus torazame TaxID=75743 RepID=A0A401NSG9_SCYTO|nr:hypothetical protein [Scyliorhinus torazame]
MVAEKGGCGGKRLKKKSAKKQIFAVGCLAPCLALVENLWAHAFAFMLCATSECVPLARVVTPEAIGFLSAVGVFVVLLAVLFLFINKKLCFEKIGGLPCLELKRKKKRVREKAGIHRGLAHNKLTGAC